MGETRVDLLHLLEDLRDAYPASLEETILTEIVANSLDSGATRITLETHPEAGTLTVVDDGRGMSRRELARYHDLATTSKQRGRGIGFAGVGIKLGLLACDAVMTETRRGKAHIASSWHLKSRHRAPWKWVPPPGLVSDHGTGVRLTVTNRLSPLLDAGFAESTLRRHFAPLLDPTFDEILGAAYPNGVRFLVNGRHLERVHPQPDRVAIAARLPRKRKPSAYGYLIQASASLPEDERGLAVSTLGKVIKRGWDWLGVTPGAPERVTGLVEVPTLAECLTLNKADFLRSGQRGALYLAYRKAIQEAAAEQLAAWGDMRDEAADQRRRRTRPVERDLQSVLLDLADQFPLLATLVDRRPGGQRRLALGGREAAPMAPGTPLIAEPVVREATQEPPGAPQPEPPPAQPESDLPATPPPAEATLPGKGPKRPAHYGLAIRYESRPDDPAMGWLVESIVWVNVAHPAFRRAAASRAEGYHLALTVAMALAPLAVEPSRAHDFVTAFMARWGEEAEKKPRRSRRRRGRS